MKNHQKCSVYAPFEVLRYYSHSTRTKQFRLCTFAFCLSHYFDFTIYLYYPVLKRPCYHFVIEVDNKNNFTVDNMETVCVYYSVLALKLQYVFQNLHAVFTKSV